MQPSLHIGNYTLLYRIGCGSFASVYMGINDLIGYPVAIKQIRREICSTEKEKIRLQREVSIMKKSMHQYIAELFEIIDNEDEPYIYLVLELVSNGSLKSMLVPDQPLSEDLARKIFSQLIVAVGYLHFDLNIIHRDLKAENILLDQNQNIRLIDFGLSTTLTLQSADIQRTACGSPAYAAPEIIVQDSYTESADIWSLGILLYLMTTGHFPFDTNSVTKLLNDIVSAPIEIPTNLSIELQNLLAKILEKNVKNRISLIGIMKHPWFINHGYFYYLHQGSSLSRCQPQNLNANSNTNPHSKSNLSITKFDKKGQLPPFDDDDIQYKKCFESLIPDNSFDLQIVDELRKKGVDVSNLKSSLLNHEMNQITACYRIMCRSKIMEHFNVSYFVDKDNSNASNSYISLDFLNNHQQQKRGFPICRISTYPVNRISAQDEFQSSTTAAETAKIILPQCKAAPRQIFPTKTAKSKSDPVHYSNVPTKVAPRQIIQRRRRINGIPKSLGGFEIQQQQNLRTINNNNADNQNDPLNQRQPPPQNQQQYSIILKEQHQQQQ